MFVKGQSGNPNGRPKKEKSLTDLFEKYLADKDPETGVIRKKLFVEECYKAAMAGDSQMRKYLWDRLEGSPAQTQTVNLNLPQIVEVDIGESEGPSDTGHASAVEE